METLRQAWMRTFSKAGANLALRCVLMFCGILCIACGIALAKHSCTGTSPISSLPAVLTEISARSGHAEITMGTWTFAFNALFFLAEITLLRRKFAPIQLLQIPLFFVLSASVDLWLSALSAVTLASYAQQLLCLLLSVVVLGFGIRIQLASGLLMTPGDAIVQVIAYVAKRPFATCKVVWDVSLMTAAAALSLASLGGLCQVREGTIISALLVGAAVAKWGRALSPLRPLLPRAPRRYVAPLIPSDRATDTGAEAAGEAASAGTLPDPQAEAGRDRGKAAPLVRAALPQLRRWKED